MQYPVIGILTFIVVFSDDPMLDLDTVSRGAQKMPVDFAQYLLSTSPPATNLELLSYAFSPEAARNWTQNNRNEAEKEENNNVEKIDNDFSRLNLNGKVRRSAAKEIKSIIIRKEDGESDCDWSDSASAQSSGRATPTSPCSPKTNKKVSFADHKGLALATVRIMTEPSDQPPRLGPEVLKSITNGAEAVVSGLPPFRLNFQQPASDYMAFRDKIEKGFVSLENVILRDYNVLGTIKVKNICFEKRVFVRCTFDSWKTSQDVEAKYVQPFGGNMVHNFDTFSFEFDIDSQIENTQIIQFAVCFETPTGQNWDSNNGENYRILPTDFNSHSHLNLAPLPSSTQPTLNRVDSWTEYGCWHHVDTSSPYY